MVQNYRPPTAYKNYGNNFKKKLKGNFVKIREDESFDNDSYDNLTIKRDKTDFYANIEYEEESNGDSTKRN